MLFKKKKQTKIEYVNKEYNITEIYKISPECAYLLKDLCNKVRELIDEVNKLKGE